jgi:hypothetical protein
MTKASPPPPYVHDLSSDVTEREEEEISPLSINYWDERSREELADLLTRADGLIRQRERGTHLLAHGPSFSLLFPKSSVLHRSTLASFTATVGRLSKPTKLSSPEFP